MIRAAQLLLVAAAGALWAAARLPWVVIQSFDGLGPPMTATLSGAQWSTALRPLALLLLAGAIATLAVRSWSLRALAVLVALASLAAGYLGISLWAIGDVAVRGADVAHVPLVSLVGSHRFYAGAAITLAAAVCMLVAAVLLMRSSAAPSVSTDAMKYAAPATRRSTAHRTDAETATGDLSERMIWDALDAGHDPTDRARESTMPQDTRAGSESDTEGR